jgi:hypothetical protein
MRTEDSSGCQKGPSTEFELPERPRNNAHGSSDSSGSLEKPGQKFLFNRDKLPPTSNIFGTGQFPFASLGSEKPTFHSLFSAGTATSLFGGSITQPTISQDKPFSLGSAKPLFGTFSIQQTSSKETPSSLDIAPPIFSDPKTPKTSSTSSQDNQPIRTSDEDLPFTRYFIYKTAESTYVRGYNATAWWETDSEDDDSYELSSEDSGESSDFESQLWGPMESYDADVEESDSDGSRSESEEDTVYPEKKKKQDPFFLPHTNSALLTPGDVDGILSQAIKSVSGKEFLGLGKIMRLIHNLTGVSLLDATWRTFEVCTLRHGRRGRLGLLLDPLDVALRELNWVLFKLDLMSFHEIRVPELVKGKRWEDLDRTLQAVKTTSEVSLRLVLRAALEHCHGEVCLEILSPWIDELPSTELKDIQESALLHLKYSSGPLPIRIDLPTAGEFV